MTHDQIRAAIASGQRAADVARDSGLPLTHVHRIVHGRGYGCTCTPMTRACAKCGGEAKTRGGMYAICDSCRPDHFAAQSAATNAVRKAINVGMLPPAKARLCVDCGAPAEHYDHRDYARPLHVEPVCRSCNILRGVAA